MNKKLIMILPIISGIFWGSGGAFVRILNSYGLDSVSIFSSRVCLATLILFLLLLIFDRESLKIDIKDIWIFIGSGIIGVMLLNLCNNEAAFTLTLSLTAVLLSLAPIFTIIFSAVLFDEKITQKKIICIILAFIGCVLVSGALENTGGLTLSAKGMIFGLLSAVFWALYGIFSKFATNKGYSTFTTIFYSFLLISLFLVIPTNWGLFIDFININPVNNSLFALAHTLCTSILPYLLFTISLKYLETGKCSILCSSSEPVSATMFGLIIFGENMSILNVIGIIVTIIAISILTSTETNS